MKPVIFSAVLSTLVLSACSPIINTVNGLITFQSTISGSNYPFSVNKEGKLTTEYTDIDAKNIIGKKESFEISLDSIFIRYLQASEPYVMIYSEAWMGSEVMPIDKKKLQRQIVLIKDGLSFNAGQPITSIPILGPVTMGDDAMNIHISFSVVVLSKDDNRQTIDFLNGAVAVASTVAPQYSLIAGAAAEVGKTIVAQNRDKIEFEHTFNLTPIHSVNGVFNQKKLFGPNLVEGKLVVIKGENEDRLVPYPNWFYYISPFNWLGHAPESTSIRFENSTYGPFFKERENYTLPNLPFVLLDYLLIPNNSWATWNTPPKSPEELTVCANYLMTLNDQKNCNLNTKDINFINRLYHDKTYAILSIKRTDGSYGSFTDLYAAFDKAGYGSQIDGLLTTRDESLTQSKEAADSALASIKSAVTFERAKKQLAKMAVQGLSNSKTVDDVLTENNITNKEDKARLENIYWEELALQSAKRLKSKVDSFIKLPSATKQNFCKNFATWIAYEQNLWRIKTSPDNTASNRNIAWSSILQGLASYLSETDSTTSYAVIITNNLDNLAIQDSAKPNSNPVLNCS